MKCPFLFWKRGLGLSLVAFLWVEFSAFAGEEVLVADFEGETYGDWKVEGEAFGPGPARGTLPNQMEVSGFLGKRLVNSFFHGDDSTGMLTSPPFPVQRKYINFLIGGGAHAEKTCINLLLGDKIVRTATGPNDRPGGSERLGWHTWDVGEFTGKNVTIQIVDQQTGGWGHINVDHIVQSDRQGQEEPAQREILVTNRYLHLPVKTGAPHRRMRYVVEGKTVREFDIELAEDAPSFWAFSEVGEWKGKNLRVEVKALPADSKGLAAITQADDLKNATTLYREKDRPQFHFTSRRGWLNDPNGLVYSAGEYHLFYQLNPYGWDGGEGKHWGLATSTDLVHWTEQPVAIYPHQYGDWVWSGSAVVDKANTSGFQSGKEDLLVAAYTSTGRGECIVYSNDRGRTWQEYSGNPVVKHSGRDPRLLWHEPTHQWVMAVYDEFQRKQWVAFHTSPDLKTWQLQSRTENFYECPDLFALPVEGDPTQKKWVLSAADGKYLLGQFDGHAFTRESGKHQVWFGNFYAAQTFSNTPDGRRIQIGWAAGISFPNAAFNQQLNVPCRLTLRATDQGVRVFAEPVQELEALRGQKHSWTDFALKPDENPLAGITGDLFDLVAEFEVGDAEFLGFTIRGVSIAYDVKKQKLTCLNVSAPLPLLDGKIRLRLLVDRASVEIFGNDGRVAMSVGIPPRDRTPPLSLLARGGTARLHSLEVFELKSSWR